MVPWPPAHCPWCGRSCTCNADTTLDTTDTYSTNDIVYVMNSGVSATELWVDPVLEKVAKHARNKVDQSLDCEQFRRPPKRSGRGRPPTPKWGPKKTGPRQR